MSHTAAVAYLAFSLNGTTFVSGSWDHTLRRRNGIWTVHLFEHPTKGKLAEAAVRVRGTGRRRFPSARVARRRHGGRLKHPHVLLFPGVLETETDLSLVSPYAKNGFLDECISLHPEVDRQRLLQGAAAAIAFLHRNSIVHGEIEGFQHPCFRQRPSSPFPFRSSQTRHGHHICRSAGRWNCSISKSGVAVGGRRQNVCRRCMGVRNDYLRGSER